VLTAPVSQGNVKDAAFGLDFFRRFAIVLNGLDNVEARRHVNRLCLAAGVPLIESGTTGYLGQAGPSSGPGLARLLRCMAWTWGNCAESGARDHFAAYICELSLAARVWLKSSHRVHYDNSKDTPSHPFCVFRRFAVRM